MSAKFYLSVVFAFFVSAAGLTTAVAQPRSENTRQKVRTVTIPISFYTKKELATDRASEFIEADQILVKEDLEDQAILSIRSVATNPLSLAILIQDELTTDVNLQLSEIARFIRGLPKGTRVMVGYIRGGSLDIRQKFTDDQEKAAKSLRLVTGSSNNSTNGPFGGLSDALGKFDGLPGGRRAVLLVSDGFDANQMDSLSGNSQSPDLDRAIVRAQKRGIAVYSIFTSGPLTVEPNSRFTSSAQGSLQKVSDETGGRAFFQGLSSPVSFEPFFKDLVILTRRQFALTYLSTHMKKGYHKVQVISTNPEVKVQYPSGYFYR
jgi:VWFA-related protein